MTDTHSTHNHNELPQPKKPTWWVYVLVAIVTLIVFQKIGCGPIRTEEKVHWLPR